MIHHPNYITPKHPLNSVSTSAGGIRMNALQRSIPRLNEKLVFWAL